MKLKTNKLLLISLIITAITFLFGTFWEPLGFEPEQTPVLAFSLMIAFGLNVAGLIFALTERSKDHKKSNIGLIGHLTLIVGFLAISGYALLTMN